MKKKQGFWRTVWESLKAALFTYSTCQKCGKLILGNHRWHQVRRKRWGKVKIWAEHRSCENPTENPETYHAHSIPLRSRGFMGCQR